jgi:soluble lytic murein transglycosylase-like protein
MPTNGFGSFGGFGVYSPAATSFGGNSSMAASQAAAAGVPASLVDRVIRRESGGNARAVHAGNYGLDPALDSARHGLHRRGCGAARSTKPT